MKPEQRTRQEKIDIQLGRAGWSVGSRHLIQEYLVASSLLKPPFTAIGDPEGFFGKSELEDLLELTRSVAV